MKQIYIIVKNDLKNYFRTAQCALFLSCFMVVFYYTSYWMIENFQNIEKIGFGFGNQARFSFVTKIIEKFLKDRSILKALSPTLTFLFVYGLFSTPFAALLVYFDQCSGMLGSKYIRYLTPRVNRTRLYIAKFTSATLIYIIALFAILLPVGIYAVKHTTIGTTQQNILYLGKMYISLFALGFPFLALNAMFGAMIPYGFVTFICSISYYFVIGLMATMFAWFEGGAAKVIPYFSPSVFKYEFLSQDPKKVAIACLACLGYAVVFFTIGLLTIRKRDI